MHLTKGIEEIESYLDKEFRFVFTDAEGHTHDTLFQDVVYLGNSGKYQILYQSYSSSFKRFVAFINNRLNAFLEEIEANAEFPILVVDEDNNALIVHGFNPEDTADINKLRLRLQAINKPIPIHLSNRDLLIYYDNSLTYNQLNSFLEDIERSADFPIIVVDAKGQAVSAHEYEMSSLTGKRLQKR